MENVPYAIFTCRANSHPFQERTVSLAEPVKIGRSVARTRPASNNVVFDCKVLSRNHALLWYENGKFYLKDTKSSNGTFANNQRLSKGSEESAPNEVNSGDIVQFGVDVIENSRRVTHGCIVSQIRLFLPNGEEARQSEMTINPNLLDKVHHNLPYPQIPSQDLYQLHHLLQEALHREQMLEQKLAFLQRLITGMQESSEKSWQALIDEDKLLSRLEFLENQLQLNNDKNTSEDSEKNQLLKLQEEKQNYEATSNEAMRKALQEKLEVQRKLTCLERTFSNTEDECTHLRITQKKTEQELLDLNTKYQQQATEAQKVTETLNALKLTQAEEETNNKKKIEELQETIASLKEENKNLENSLREEREKVPEKIENLDQEKIDIKIKSDENENITCTEKKDNNEIHNGALENHVMNTETLHGNSYTEKPSPQTIEKAIQTENNVLTGQTQTLVASCDQFTNTNETDDITSTDKLKVEVSNLKSQLSSKEEIINMKENNLNALNTNFEESKSEKEKIQSEFETLEKTRESEMKVLSNALSELRLALREDSQVTEVTNNTSSVDDMCKTLHEISQVLKSQEPQLKETETSLTPDDVNIEFENDVETNYKELQTQSDKVKEQLELVQQLIAKHTSKCLDDELDEERSKCIKGFKERLSSHTVSYESFQSDSLHTDIKEINPNTVKSLCKRIKESSSYHQTLLSEITTLSLDIVTCFAALNEKKLSDVMSQKDSKQKELINTQNAKESLEHELSQMTEQHNKALAASSCSGTVQVSYIQLVSVIVVIMAMFLALLFRN